MLTDAELTERAATKVMGWGLVKRISGGLMFDRHDRCHLDIEEWQPLTDIRAAWEIVEKMRERGMWLKLTSPFNADDVWNAGFTDFGFTGWNGRPDYREQADAAPRAITIAALLAVGAVTKEEVEID